MANDRVFSEFFLDQIGIRFADDEEAMLIDCVGQLDEEFTMKTITKSCRGRVKKSRSKPESGSITINAHFPYETKLELYGMIQQAAGVYGYGTDSMHAECVVTAKVRDEDDNIEYRAYPAAVATSKTLSINDDDTEVSMDEIEFDIMPDDDEIIVYQALDDDITSDSIRTNWMSNFTPELVAPTA